ncbi:MAG: DNA alkylation repair protein [Verrucomicrobiae bacterium]|nr:DNA alkylation repair protein [Verrucomicrobiae bacterium]
MAEPLKNSYGPEIPKRLADQIARVSAKFNAKAFLREVMDGYLDLELMPRGRHIARVLARHLPADFPAAVDILLRSLGENPQRNPEPGMSSFFYLPHCHFVAENGLAHFEESMRAYHVLTKLFTAEFSIRPFLEKHEKRTLARLHEWASDPDEHVRRLVSEGTRPRLPWAARLRSFQKNPAPVLELLELLKDDPSEYVRRSVANNLNDIGKDHPRLLVQTARRWLRGAGTQRRRLIRHALRSAVKQGDPAALHALGYGEKAAVTVQNAAIVPARVRVGGNVLLQFDLQSRSRSGQRVMVDFQVHFVKDGGRTRPKVFKLKAVELGPGEHASFKKSVSLRKMTTRRHHPGKHRVDLLLNGAVYPLGAFDLLP